MRRHLNFSYKKATQALNFFALKSRHGRISKLRVLKLVFFADRYHLRKYGRFLTNDEYWAMEFGPVASGVKDIAELHSCLDPREKAYAEKFLTPVYTNLIKSTAPVDTDELSKSELEALGFSWREFGRVSQIVDLTHAYPEWKNHEEFLKTNTRARMDIVDFLEDSDSNVDECYHLTRHEKDLRLDELEEVTYVNSLWS